MNIIPGIYLNHHHADSNFLKHYVDIGAIFRASDIEVYVKQSVAGGLHWAHPSEAGSEGRGDEDGQAPVLPQTRLGQVRSRYARSGLRLLQVALCVWKWTFKSN